jgi:hypothetical protein
VGDRCRTITAEPVIIAGRLCCCAEFAADNDVCDKTDGSFRLLFINKSDGGGGPGSIANNDDFDVVGPN